MHLAAPQGSKTEGPDPFSQVTIIGAGSMGSALGRALHAAGHTIHAVFSRSEESAEKLAATVDADTVGQKPAEIPEGSLVILTVPDDSIENVASELAEATFSWEATCVLHTSGALSSSLLAPLSNRGAYVASMHPLVAVTQASSVSVFEGSAAVIEGDDRCLSKVYSLARSIQMRPVAIQTSAKPLYHTAATLLSNGTVALMDAGCELLQEGGMSSDEALALLRPLLSVTCENLAEVTPQHALTGPVSRGDVNTVKSHIASLDEHDPRLSTLYRALSRRLLRIAREARTAPREKHTKVDDALGD